jgi:glycosyltransferase involved in cell wall biosynthesis
MVKVVHIAAHLGGGVGRVLSQVAKYRQVTGSPIRDVFVCLEAPRERRFVEALADAGAPLVAVPGEGELDALLAGADIVQLEWWHHPLLARWLVHKEPLQARLVVWCHTSGIHYPTIPPAFSALPHAFMVTTSASLPLLAMPDRTNLLTTVNSSGGFEDLAVSPRDAAGPARFGYLGAFNPAKLHPRLTEFIDAVRLPGFAVDFYGDPSVNAPLLERAERDGPEGRIRLRGYTPQPAEVLANMDVLIYLLNPMHYGTTENALLEAMACGVVPVVLDNPVERAIVRHDETGVVVNSPEAFAAAVNRLATDRGYRQRLAAACSRDVRQRYSVAATAAKLDAVYAEILRRDAAEFSFSPIFGKAPADHFLAGLGRYRWCFADQADRRDRRPLAFLYERSKSSAFQFFEYFPADPRLARWVAALEDDLVAG